MKKAIGEASFYKTCVNAGGLTSAALLAVLMLALPLFQSGTDVEKIVYTVTVPLVLLLPFAVSPLIYNLIHGIKSVILGRFHGIYVVSLAFSAVFFVLSFTGFLYGALRAVCVVLSLAVFCVSELTYLYASSSIRTRLGLQSIRRPSRTHLFVSAFGGLVTLGAYIVAYIVTKGDFTQSAVCTVYAAAIAMLIGGFVEYLATYQAIPRLTSSRPRTTVKESYKTFFSGLKLKTFFSLLLSVAAILTLVVYAFYRATDFGIESLYSGGVFIVAFAVSSVLANKYIVRVKRGAPLVCLLLTLLSCAAIISGLVLAPVFIMQHVSIPIVMATCGIALGICLREAKLRYTTIKDNVTSGVVESLYGMTLSAAVALTYLLLLSIMPIGNFGMYIVLGIVAVFAVVAYAFVFKKRSSQITVEVELKSDLTPEPTREASSNMISADDAPDAILSKAINSFDIDGDLEK